MHILPEFIPIGTRFGRWAVSGDRSRVTIGHAKYTHYIQCRCECGNEKPVIIALLKSGKSQSCGCLKAELSSSRHTHHHSSQHGKRSSEYSSWANMKQRCNNPKSASYHNYGGRGIRVCEAWGRFDRFLADMGTKPTPDYEIDRIDHDGIYAPWNCRWVTNKQNSNNKRTNVLLEHEGERMTVNEWAEKLSISPNTIRYRLGAGWPVERALKR